MDVIIYGMEVSIDRSHQRNVTYLVECVMYGTNHIGPTCQVTCGPSFDRWHNAYALGSSMDIVESGNRGQQNVRDSWYEGEGEVER